MNQYLKFALVIILYGIGFTICDGTYWKEFVLALFLFLGDKLNRDF